MSLSLSGGNINRCGKHSTKSDNDVDNDNTCDNDDYAYDYEIDNDDDITSERDIQTPTNEDRGFNYSDCEAESVGNEEEKVDIISTPPEEQNQAGVNDADQESDIGKRAY